MKPSELKNLPDAPGVYLMRDRQGRVLYVGKATSLRSRVRSYFQPGQEHTARIRWMVSRVDHVETMVVGGAMEALVLECNLIKQHRPPFNVKYRDDKRYPLLEMTMGEEYPRLKLVRTRRNSKSRYFGPYADAGALRRTMKILQGVFRIRTCKINMGRVQKRPCLDYYIELCTAPCTRCVDAREYRQQVLQACKFLEGHTDELMRMLREEMAEEARELNFERCARIRNMLADLERVSEKQRVVLAEPEDEDYCALVHDRERTGVQVLQIREGKLVGQHYLPLDTQGESDPSAQMAAFLKQYYQPGSFLPRRIYLSHLPEEAELLASWLSETRKVELKVPQRGEKRQLMQLARDNGRQGLERDALMPSRFEQRRKGLDQLAEALGLEGPPWRIECVDISNIHGQQAVGSLVVFEQGMPRKDQYRRFRIRSGDTPDDFRMMGEVLTRRFRAAQHELQRRASPPRGDEKFSVLPDLLVCDGGKGQLGVAVQVLAELGLTDVVPVAALAKENEWLFLPGRSQPVILPRGTEGLTLVTHLRDEAHRFAITYHRGLRQKVFKLSELESAPGIGKERREALMRHFGSLKRLRAAKREELATVAGIGPRLADQLYRFLHPAEELSASS